MHRSTFVMLMLMRLVEGTDYLVALPHTSFKSSTPSVGARTDETGGILYCEDPNFEWRRYTDISPWSSRSISLHPRLGTFSNIEYKAFHIVSTNSDASVEITGRYFSFAPLPITALGNKYIVSSCRQSRYYSLFVIAAFNLTTTVSIKARSPIFGPSFNYKYNQTFELKPFQTFTYQHYSDLTETAITSTQPIAIFSGMVNSTFLTAYEQLLPVRRYDREYIVVVDENPALYNLQILSEQNDTVITFNNGSSLTINTTLYKAQLTSEERSYFKSSNPVMATICRRDGERSGLVVIPPVSQYFKTAAYIYRDSIFITRQETFINSSDLTWFHIPNSGYKTGVLARRSITTNVHGCNLLFSQYYIKTDGIKSEQSNRIAKRKSYLVALPKWSHSYAHLQLRSSHATSYQVVFPGHNQSHSRQIFANGLDTFYIEHKMKVEAGVENKAIRVDLDSVNTQLSLVEYYMNRYSLSIYPTSVLGQKYIIQACYGNKPTETQLIIVSSFMNTDISILPSQDIIYDRVEYKHGDNIKMQLRPYQTLTINSSVDLCGTTVSASHNIAVFTLNRFGSMTTDYRFGVKTINYNQLLPVEKFGQEYVVTTSDQGEVQYINDFHIERVLAFNSQYYILVTSATNSTQLKLSENLQVTVGAGKAYRKDLQKNESLHILSTKPVMVSLCTDITAILETKQLHHSGCSKIVPVSLFTNKTMFKIIENAILKIVTNSRDAEIMLRWSDNNHWNVTMDITWETHSHFKIGTARVTSGLISIFSTESFTTIAFSDRDRYVSFSNGDIVGNMWNPVGWISEQENDGIGEDMTTEAVSDAQDDHNDNSTVVAIGTTLSILILFLVAAIICQQIYIRRNTSKNEKKTDARTGETEASFNQDHQGDRRDASTVSTPTALYSELQTEHQATNTYESINLSFSTDKEVEYENAESRF